MSTDAFEKKLALPLPEIGCHFVELVHKQSGARVIHIANDDRENAFCLSFQTLPNDSTGVAHILEHTVLCGSEKFPVKDPFFSMMRRSLHTFMNAFTGNDFTCYPAASQVKKDFYNLLEVYSDAVFHPKLDPMSFAQEGHRLEFSVPDDPTSSLQYQGVVFNEMKGVMSSPVHRLSEGIMQALFPDTTYSQNSGGDPTHIPDLTYSQFLTFHKQYYHPSRCLFFFYGNLPLEGHLHFLSETILKGVSQETPIPHIPKQPRFTRPVYRHVPYPIEKGEGAEKKWIVSLNWLTVPATSQMEILALTILLEILMGTDAAPLKEKLLKSGLCQQASCSIEAEFSEVPISIVLKGCKKDSEKEIEAFLLGSLQENANTDLNTKRLEDAIHQLEFHRSEITSSGMPYGLSLFLRSTLIAQHGADPAHALQIHSLCQELTKKPIAYYKDLLTTHFLQNTHRALVTAYPDPDLSEREREQEREKLEKIETTLDGGKKRKLLEQTHRLRSFQHLQEEQNLEVLPKITLKDVPKTGQDFPLTHRQYKNFDLYTHSVFTNGILYLDLAVPLPQTSERQLPLIKLLSVILPQVASGTDTYGEVLEKTQAHTGGIGASLSLNRNIADPTSYSPLFFLHGKALHRHKEKLVSLMLQMLTQPNFEDAARLKEIMTKHYRSLENSLTGQAMHYATTLSSSHLDTPSRILEAWGGIEYFQTIRQTVQNFDKEFPKLTKELTLIAKGLLGSLDVIASADPSTLREMQQADWFALSTWKKAKTPPWEDHFSLSPRENEGRTISSPVACVASTIPSVGYLSPHAPALSIATHLLDRLTLHPKIREKGGAYGGGASFAPSASRFLFYAYRSPSIVNALNAFDEGVKRICKGEFTEQELEESKLEVIQELDLPVSPGDRGHVAYTWKKRGKNKELREAFRKKIIETKQNDVVEAARKMILPNMKKMRVVSFGEKELLERENLSIEGCRRLKIHSV